jgi:hypothetical protein
MLLPLAAALVSTSCCAATPVTYRFAGAVTASTKQARVVPGQLVPIVVTLDTSFPANSNSPYPGREAVYSGGACTYPNTGSPILAVTVKGLDAHGCYDLVRIERNVAGVSSITINSASSQGGPSLALNFSSTLHGAVKSLAIPKHIDPEQFKTTSFSTAQNYDVAFSGTIVRTGSK